jgi:malonate-semialdehyde dehydrogenase (acetylating)/methylmalonate-semialdehyde dehydrogenase
MTRRLQNFINGKPTDAQTDRWGDVFDPAVGQVASHVPMSTRADVDSAVAAARAAFAPWSATPPVRRARVLFRFKALIDEELAKAEARIAAGTPAADYYQK